MGVVYVIVNLAFENYVKSKLDGIVGLEFHIKRLEAKSKLSQNKETTDYTSVMGKMGELRLMGLNKRMKSLIQINQTVNFSLFLYLYMAYRNGLPLAYLMLERSVGVLRPPVSAQVPFRGSKVVPRRKVAPIEKSLAGR